MISLPKTKDNTYQKLSEKTKPPNTGGHHLFLTYLNMSLKFPIHGLSVSFPGNVLYCSDSSLFPSVIPLFLQFGEGMPILSLCNQAFPFTRIHRLCLFLGDPQTRTLHFFRTVSFVFIGLKL